MLLERPVDFQESRFRYPLTQNFFTAKIANQVKRDTAQGRSQGGQDDVKNKTPAVLIDVSHHDSVYRHAKQRGVHPGNGEYPPHPERLKQRPDPRRVARQNMSYRLQRELSLSEYS